MDTSPTQEWKRAAESRVIWERDGILPDPQELGIPLPGWRPVQVYALMEALTTDKKVVIINAPTGTGKTSLGAAFAALATGRAVYSCHAKDLQRQALHDIPYSQLLMGRANYPTLDHPHQFPTVTCDDCDRHAWGDCPQCAKTSPPNEEVSSHCTCCHDMNACPYKVAKAEALDSPLLVANNHYLLAEANHVGFLSGWPLLVMDEADLLESVLMDAVSVEFTPARLKELGVARPSFKGTTSTAVGQAHKLGEWGAWLENEVIPAIGKLVGAGQAAMNKHLQAGRMGDYRLARRKVGGLERLEQACAWMLSDLKESPESWVRVDSSDGVGGGGGGDVPLAPRSGAQEPPQRSPQGTLRFKPIRVARYAKDLLWRHADRALLMSATIISHTQLCRDLGLAEEDVEFIDLPCTFPLANRPLFVLPAAKVTYANMPKALPLLAATVDQILSQYPCRVLIHTHTYDIARYLLTACQERARMLTYSRPGEDPDSKARAVADYVSRPDAVLVAPSLERGIDLRDDLCRCQIICKVPYPSLGDRQVSQRFHSGQEGRTWYAVQTVRALVQMSGRAIRSDTDWAHTYILDAEFERFFHTHRDLFSDWWRDGVKRVYKPVGLGGEAGRRVG